HETFDEDYVKFVGNFVASKDRTVVSKTYKDWTKEVHPSDRADALRVLAELHRQRPQWDGKWWGTQPVKGAPEPKTVDWAGTPLVLAAITGALKDPAPEVRRAAVE